MPLSRPECIPRVINYIWETNPSSLLDIGCGYGGMGVLFRQVMDVRWGRVDKKDWKTIIDGVEINGAYRNPCWDVYNYMTIADIREVLPSFRKFDVIFFGDVLEHFKKEDALDLIKVACNLGKSVIITTPQNFSGNEAEAERFGNPNEEHKCVLEDEDFPKGSIIEKYGGQKFVLINQ